MLPQRPLLTKEHRPFGRGPTTALSGLKHTMVISYLLTRNDPPIRAELADTRPVVHHDVTVSMSRDAMSHGVLITYLSSKAGYD